jgi:hypothetical protein
MRHMISQRVLAVLCAGAVAGCASGRRTSHEDGSPVDRPSALPHAVGGPDVADGPDEAGAPDAAHAGRAPASGIASVVAALSAVATPAGAAEAGRTGALEVTVTFADAPPHLRRSPGRDACGAARAPRVRVHTMGGVDGAVVYVRGPNAEAAETAPAAPARRDREQPAGVVAVRQCRVEPRVAVAQPGQILAVINDDERRLDVRIERLALNPALPALPAGARAGASQAGASAAGAGPSGPEPAATLALPVIGSRVDLRWSEPGVYRVAAADTEPGFVVVPGASRAGVTSAVGQVRLAALPIGSYDVIVWHPPLNDADAGAPVVEQAQVTIAPGQTSQLTIPLTPR